MEVDSSDEEDEEFFDLVAFFSVSVTLLASQQALVAERLGPGWKLGCSVIQRDRVPVEDIFGRLDERWFKRCYRMSKSLFWKLKS